MQKKLLNLFTGELTSTMLFAILYVFYIQQVEWTVPYLSPISSIFSFCLLEFILLQGSLYWYLKWRQGRRKDFRNLKDSYLHMYRWFKIINCLFIMIGIVVGIALFVNDAVNRYWYLFVFAFACIEHINYFHIRLSYMSISEMKEFVRQKGFRRSILAKELGSIKKS
nr:hypothetical protein [Lysinibacillus timonensis]